MTTQLEKLTSAENADGIEYRVPSRTNPHETYLVNLTDFFGNGRCNCKDFECRRQPLLSRMVKPEEAAAQGLIKLNAGQKAEDCLRCAHIMEARRKFTDDVLHAVAEKERHEARGRH